jgi:hypothetical protein
VREVFDIAVLAYRNGNYHDSLNLMLQVTDTEPNDWLARLYVGMIYQKLGRIPDSQRCLKRLVTECNDAHIKEKATGCLQAVESLMQSKFSKENFKPAAKIQPAPKHKDDYDDIVWVG